MRIVKCISIHPSYWFSASLSLWLAFEIHVVIWLDVMNSTKMSKLLLKRPEVQTKYIRQESMTDYHFKNDTLAATFAKISILAIFISNLTRGFDSFRVVRIDTV